jgi:preprotein translocase subunit SecD
MSRRALRALANAARSGLLLCCLLAGAISVPRAVSAEPLVVQLTHAELGFDQRTGEPVISFTMSEASGAAFADITRNNVGKPLAMRADGRVLSRPVIREPILGGKGQISGQLTVEEAKDLALRLSTGAARLEFEIASD